MEQPRYLILENGSAFRGRPFGKSSQVIAEIVFTTSMTGYLETLTDPSYYGQMVVQAFPMIGNYGVIPADFEAENPAMKAAEFEEKAAVGRVARRARDDQGH